MKRILSALLVLVMCASMLALTASAEEVGGWSASASNKEIVTGVGGTVTITVSLTNNPGVAGMIIASSAPSGFDVSLTGTGLSGWTTGAGGTKAMWDSATDTNFTGPILTATVKVDSSVEPGTYTVSFTNSAANANLDDVIFGTASVTITVVEPPHECNYNIKVSDATCETGSVYKCSCGKTITKEDAKGHNYPDDWTVTKEATCTETGAKVKVCANGCGLDKNETIAALGHTKDGGKVTTEAGCETTGVMTFYCTKCGEVADTSEISAKGHNYQPKSPATCVAEGVNVCEGCGDEQKTEIDPDNHIDVNPEDKVCDACGKTLECVHQWDNGKVTVKPTCDKPGVKTYTCKLCQETKTENILPKGHKWEWIVDKKPTGSSDGVKHEECSECGAKRNEGTVIPKIEGLDDVPQTGDITNQITMSVAAVVVMMVAAVAFVFKRKAAK